MTAPDPDWLAAVTEQLLLGQFGRNATQAGLTYAESGRVGRISQGGGSPELVLNAQVRGSGYRTYHTVVRYRPTAGWISSTCTCPVRNACKHGVAVMWAAREAGVRLATPSWQRALEQVAEQVRRADVPGTPLALQFDRGSTGQVTLRPLMRGKQGRWVKSGISWDALDRGGGSYVEAHLSLLLALKRTRRVPEGYGYYGYRSDVLNLGELGPQAWSLLAEAKAAGVDFVPAAGVGPVRLLPEPARLVAGLTRDGDEGLVVESRVEADGRRWSLVNGNLIGEPPHGVVLPGGDDLLLGAFDAPLTAAQRSMLLQHPRVRIPADDVAVFAAGFLPALRRVIELEVAPDVELPRIEPPTVSLRVRFDPGHATRLTWGFRYVTGSSVVEVGANPAPQDPPVRDADGERKALAGLPQQPWAIWTDSSGRLRLVPDVHLRGAESAAFVTDWLPVLQELPGLTVTLSEEAPTYRRAEAAPVVSLAVSDPAQGVTDWFNLDIRITIDDETVDFRDLFTALARGESHLILESGTWFSLDRPELEQLRRVITEARQLQPDPSGRLRLRAEQAGLWEELVELGVVASQSTAWRESVSALLDATAVPQVPLPAGLDATLRGYQEDGFRWLSFLWGARLGGILADDMGLGKTLQMLAVVVAAAERGELEQPVLVVAPTSVLGTWASEAARFAPGLRVVVVDRTARKRPESLTELRAAADVLVTSYTLLRLEEDDYAEDAWAAVFLDEAQFVKNRQARVYKAVRRLRARVKFAITGTPLENNLMDLWSLLSISAPGLFANPEVFTELYRRPIESGADPTALERLRRRVRPLMLRRTKEAVASELPPKTEQLLKVALTPAHRRIYDKHLAAERKKVLGLVGDLEKNRIAILASLTLLRQLSLSPALLDSRLPPQSAKIDTLVDLLEEIQAEGHRALVFSQFTSFLRLVRDRLDAEKIGYQYLDGRTRDRAARIDAFRTGTDPAFLISLKAGGFGLTLTEADYVFILDPWWNPAAELQAIDRTHRIGQDKNVNVYRMVSEDTIEEKVVALQDRKRDLFAQVVGDGSALAAPLNAADIRGLLQAD